MADRKMEKSEVQPYAKIKEQWKQENSVRNISPIAFALISCNSIKICKNINLFLLNQSNSLSGQKFCPWNWLPAAASEKSVNTLH